MVISLPPPQGGCATILCQPLDVLKTRLMNSKGEYQVSGGCGQRSPHPPPEYGGREPGKGSQRCQSSGGCRHHSPRVRVGVPGQGDQVRLRGWGAASGSWRVAEARFLPAQLWSSPRPVCVSLKILFYSFK